MKRETFWTIVMTVFLVACFVYYLAVKKYVEKTTEAKPAPCVAAPNESCPPQSFLSDYDEWKALNDKIEGAQKKDKDLRTGWASRLNESMPPGYYFNVDTRKFQKRELPQPVPPPHK